jgi:hypothetical protein
VPPASTPGGQIRRRIYTEFVETEYQRSLLTRLRRGSIAPVVVGQKSEIDSVVRELLESSGSSALAALDLVVREVLVSHGGLPVGGLAVDAVVREVTVSSPPAPGPIPVFPVLPEGFPVKVRPIFKTTIGTVKSGREVRAPNQTMSALWEIELLFDELRDQTQNATIFQPMVGYTDFEQLVQIWLMMYGQTNVFAFDAPWDDSRANQLIGYGDGSSYIFPVYRTWGLGTAELTELVGVINQVTQVKVGGSVVPATNYYTARNKIYFIDKFGIIHPPAFDAPIVMTFSFYYLCTFLADEQDFVEFSQGRWTVPSLKFRSTYWP